MSVSVRNAGRGKEFSDADLLLSERADPPSPLTYAALYAEFIQPYSAISVDMSRAASREYIDGKLVLGARSIDGMTPTDAGYALAFQMCDIARIGPPFIIANATSRTRTRGEPNESLADHTIETLAMATNVAAQNVTIMSGVVFGAFNYSVETRLGLYSVSELEPLEYQIALDTERTKLLDFMTKSDLQRDGFVKLWQGLIDFLP